jgi:hypothetical protein
MLSVKGIYDGKKVVPLEEIKATKKYKLIITFVEEIGDEEEDEAIRNFASPTDSFQFWEDPREDIYQDYLTKKRK